MREGWGHALSTLCASAVVLVGNLTVSGSAAMDLAALSCLEVVTGSVSLTYNDALTSLAGLDALREVGGSLRFGSFEPSGLNPVVLDVTALGALTTIGGDLQLFDALPDVAGLESLVTIGGSLVIDATSPYTTFRGLGAVESIGDSLAFGWVSDPGGSGLSSCADHMPRLDIEGLDPLRTIGLDLRLYRTSAPTALQFPALESVGRDRTRGWLDDVRPLLGLGALTTIGTSLTIRDNAMLPTADATPLVAARESIGGAVTVTGSAP